jgi:1,2-dihydroxy-3-keto-5-methylthiopentene dioxygenase
MHAYYLNDENEEDRSTVVSEETLKKIGILHWTIETAKPEAEATATATDFLSTEGQAALAKVRKDRDYSYDDMICSTSIPDLASKMAIFFDEHLHDDEEIRLFLDGSGFFDVRDEAADGSPWVRMACEAGDMIVLPAGAFHRFKWDDRQFFRVMRLFQGEPVWTAHSRTKEETAGHDSRRVYVEGVKA